MTLDEYFHIGNLGSGAMGNIVLAKKKDATVMDKEVAMKIINKGKVLNSKIWQMMINEKLIGEKAKLKNFQYLVAIHECFISPASYVMIQEYVKYGDVEEYFNNQENKILSSFSTKIFMYELLSGVFFIHDLEYIHKDLKPANIFITSSGHIKVGDYGCAVEHNVSEKYNVSFNGTIQYSSSETVGFRPVKKSDFFSAGVILFQIRTNICPPFRIPYDMAESKFRYDFDKAVDSEPEEIHQLTEIEQDMFYGLTAFKIATRFDENAIKAHPYFENLLFEEGFEVPAPFDIARITEQKEWELPMPFLTEKEEKLPYTPENYQEVFTAVPEEKHAEEQ